MLDLRSLERPSSPEEAVRALLETEGTGMYVAGGTIIVPAGSPSLDFLVDLSGVGLEYVKVEGPEAPDGRVLTIGAMTRITDLVHHDALEHPAWRVIREAALELGTHTVRNRATVGGNLAAAHFPSDLPPAFLALGAAVVLLGPDGPREVALEDLYARRADVYRRGDLILEVRVPSGAAGLTAAFEKTGRTRVDVAIVNCAVSLLVESGTVTAARVVLNGLGAAPFVASAAAASLVGGPASIDAFEAAGRAVSDSVSPRADHRAGAEYRSKVAGIITARALARAAGLAGH